MRHWFGTFVLLGAAIFSLFTAWNSGFAPREFAARLGLAITREDGYNEIRAQYAGFFFVTATICVAALAGTVSRRSAFVVLVVVFGGLFAGRAVSLAIHRGFAGYSPTILALYVIDATALLLALTALVLDKTVAQN